MCYISLRRAAIQDPHLVHHVVGHVGDALVRLIARGRLLSHPAAKLQVGLTTRPERCHTMCSCSSAKTCPSSSSIITDSRLYAARKPLHFQIVTAMA